jgi:hypothetical protein
MEQRSRDMWQGPQMSYGTIAVEDDSGDSYDRVRETRIAWS